MQTLPSMCKSRTVTVRVQEGTALLSTNFVLKQPSRTTAPLNLLRLHHATRMIKLQCCDNCVPWATLAVGSLARF